MPTYEMTVLMRKTSHPSLVSAVKKVAVDIDMRPQDLSKIIDEYNRDKDIIQQFFLSRNEETFECENTLDLERKKPSERPSIQQLIQEGRRPPRFSKIWNPKTGLDYYPFHR